MLVIHTYKDVQYKTFIRENDIYEVTFPTDNPHNEVTVKTFVEEHNFTNVSNIEVLEDFCENND